VPALLLFAMYWSKKSLLPAFIAGTAMLGRNSSAVSPVYAPWPAVTAVGLDGIVGGHVESVFRKAVPAVVLENVQ
jgi:hypothetical protein